MGAFLGKILSLGMDIGRPETFNKKIRLLNRYCVFWSIAIPFWMVEAVSFSKYISLLVHLVTLAFLSLILYANHRRKLEVSKTLFFILVYFTLIFFAYFASNLGAEFGFILLAPLSLVFYDNKKVTLFILIVSFLTFWLPHYSTSNAFTASYANFQANPVIYQDPHTKFIIFLFVYLIVAYFKKLNKESEALLAEKNQMLSKQQDDQLRFFVNIAHEIRTPLTIIKGNADQYLKDTTAIKNISYQINNLDQLVNDIIDISKMESNLFFLKKSRININELLRKVHQNFQTSFARKSIGFSLERDEEKAFIVEADEFYLEKVFSNLLSNALKFTPRNQTVRIAMKSTDEKCFIEVIDTGLGIAVEHQSGVFTRFFQASSSAESFGGSGIGLSFCKNVVEMHEGTIDFTSQEGRGTTFTVCLPLKETIRIDQETTTTPYSNVDTLVQSDSEKPTKVLLVEDNLDMQDHIQDMLTEFAFHFADNGREAIAFLKNPEIHFDLIITDYMMPEMNGLEFIEKLQSLQIDIPVIVLSALSDQFKKQELIDLGIYDYIKKPFNVRELKASIRNCVARQSSRNEIREFELGGNEEELISSKTAISPYYDFVYKNSHDKHMNVQKMCDEFVVSQSTLYRRIKSHCGMNPREFITEVRLNKARDLVESENIQTVKYVLNAIGWSNSTYLYNLYENRYGVSLRDRFARMDFH